MKMIAIMLIIFILFLLVSCGDISPENSKDFGPYMIIEECGSDIDSNGYAASFYLLYDKDTKIVYQYLSGKGRNITPYYIIVDNCVYMAKWENNNIVPIPIS